jgi:hypothetical protein
MAAEDILQHGSSRPWKPDQKNRPIDFDAAEVGLENPPFIPFQKPFDPRGRRSGNDRLPSQNGPEEQTRLQISIFRPRFHDGIPDSKEAFSRASLDLIRG